MHTETLKKNDVKLGTIKLFFNGQTTQHTLEEIWTEGYLDAQNSKREYEKNPYPLHSREHHFWAEGWMSGFYDEKPLFSEIEPTTTSTDTKKNIKNTQKTRRTPFAQNILVYQTLFISGILCASFFTGMLFFEFNAFNAFHLF